MRSNLKPEKIYKFECEFRSSPGRCEPRPSMIQYRKMEGRLFAGPHFFKRKPPFTNAEEFKAFWLKEEKIKSSFMEVLYFDENCIYFYLEDEDKDFSRTYDMTYRISSVV